MRVAACATRVARVAARDTRSACCGARLTHVMRVAAHAARVSHAAAHATRVAHATVLAIRMVRARQAQCVDLERAWAGVADLVLRKPIASFPYFTMGVQCAYYARAMRR